jgi:hypothetical protein
MTRLEALRVFYGLLDDLGNRIGGARCLSECDGRMGWPQRGVYFFFEPGEQRTDTGNGPRVVRVGTHALAVNSRTSLWQRLSQHRGTAGKAGGNHRGSIFRLIVGAALKNQDGDEGPQTWGLASSRGDAARRLGLSSEAVQDAERDLEARVSRYIGEMPFLWVDVPDAPGPDSARGIIERGGIALLSNFRRAPTDPPSRSWLGRFSDRERVRESGLWNNNHVDEEPELRFLDVLERHINRM